MALGRPFHVPVPAVVEALNEPSALSGPGWTSRVPLPTVTVPASWLTISNGKLISVSDASGDMKTWTWRESQPSSTYLFTVVAGEFVEVKDSWRNMPVTYYAPKDRGDRLNPNYSRTPAMIELFSKTLGVEYPWEKYSQVMVDDFVAGGMENSSATTNTAESLRNHWWWRPG